MDSNQTGEVFWGNGEVRPFSESRISIFNTGVVHGDAVCEMLRTFRHQPFRVKEHLDRFRHSVDSALLQCSYSDSELSAAVNEVVKRNVKRNTENSSKKVDVGVILFVTGGTNLTYAGKVPETESETVCLHPFPLHFELWRDSLRSGQHLVLARQTAIPPECMDPTIKTRSRMHWRIADRMVKRDHPDAIAVFADEDSCLTETSSANLFVVKNGEVLTPPSDRVLNGISRQVVMELATAAGYTIKEQMIPIEQALTADEIWTSSTPYCMLPVTRFNNTKISGGEPGPVFQQIMNAWSELVEVDIRAQILAEE